MSSIQDKKNKEYIRLAITLAIIIFVLGGFIFYVTIPLLGNKTVILATQPVDPFDIIRGQYLTIRYEISTIPILSNAEVGDSVYVALEEDNTKISRYERASLTKPDDETFIKGEIKSIGSETINVEYGIEQYFFERDAEFPTSNLTVKVKLSDSGRARIIELLQNGKPIEINSTRRGLTS